MPAGKRPQSNTMLYTVIIFVGLFLVAMVVAVIFYVKAEDLKTELATAQSELEDMATKSELQKIGRIVGAKPPRKSTLGTMVVHLDKATGMIVGPLAEPDTSAEVKIQIATRERNNVLKLLSPDYINIEKIDPNAIGLVQIVKDLKNALDNLTETNLSLNKGLEQLQNEFDDAVVAMKEEEIKLLAEKERYRQQVNNIQEDYNQLETLLRQKTDEQIQTLTTQWQEERANNKQLKDNLLKTGAELQIAEDKLKYIQAKLQALVPPPDSDVAAYQHDGKVILIDGQSKIVHINLGSEDHVYRGLTFSVYDRNLPIPKDGKGKAEIEVYDVGKNFSAARVVDSQIKKPIVLNDIIANLIWDSDKANVFVIAGEFDLNSDGVIDFGGEGKIRTLVGKWGGRVVEEVTIDVDFIVMGRVPQILKKPTFEEMEVRPLAMEKHEASLRRFGRYNKLKKQAQSLSIPILTYEKFLYLIGYKTQSGRIGAF